MSVIKADSPHSMFSRVQLGSERAAHESDWEHVAGFCVMSSGDNRNLHGAGTCE